MGNAPIKSASRVRASDMDAFFATKRDSVPDKAAVYCIDQDFGGKVPYWDHYIGPYNLIMDRRLLYRPEIVNAIVERIEGALLQGSGVKVTGPLGVGKSNTLVNVVRKLESTEKYLVTFIPNCTRQRTIIDLYRAILQSFGSNVDILRFDIGDTMIEVEANLRNFMNTMDKILETRGKQWVFVLDHLSHLFESMEGKSDVGDVDCPFNTIHHLLRKGRITCVMVVSLSEHNQRAYSDDEIGFNEFTYNHPVAMSKNELRLAFPALEDALEEDIDNIVCKLTGGVPGQVHRLLKSESELRYRLNEHRSLTICLMSLKVQQIDKNRWKSIAEAAISCLVHVKVDAPYSDRRYSVLTKTTDQGRLYLPTNPIVNEIYQDFFQDELKEYVEHHEDQLLEVCEDPEVNNDLRDKVFKLLVVQRCTHGAIALENSNGQLPLTTPLSTRNWADCLTHIQNDGMHVPEHSDFTAVDLVWKSGKNCWGVQLHVSQHKDVLEKFTEMCMQANWHKTMENVYLVYLSPEKEVADLVDDIVFRRKSGWTPKVLVLCRDDIACLQDLEWPARCSL